MEDFEHSDREVLEEALLKSNDRELIEMIFLKVMELSKEVSSIKTELYSAKAQLEATMGGGLGGMLKMFAGGK
jgi:hypothetical protein